MFCVVLVVVGVSICGCFFTPRTPEPPTTSEPIPYRERTSSSSIWANAGLSLEHLDSTGWEEAISEDFTYEPDGVAELNYPDVFVDWNQEREMAFITDLYSQDISVVAQMRDPEFVPPPDTGEMVIWEDVIYMITVSSSDGSETKYRATAEITFRLEGNFWYIYKWIDVSPEEDPDNPGQFLSSFGGLRGIFASN